MRVNVYARVSTDDQHVKQQAAYVKSWAERQGFSVGEVVMDEESGRLPLTERRQFRKLLERTKVDGSGAIVVQNLERLTRNWKDVALIEDYFIENWGRVKLISTADAVDLSNAAGRLLFRMRMAVSCYMPEDMREKQRVGIERAQKEGKYKGGKKGRRWAN